MSANVIKVTVVDMHCTLEDHDKDDVITFVHCLLEEASPKDAAKLKQLSGSNPVIIHREADGCIKLQYINNKEMCGSQLQEVELCPWGTDDCYEFSNREYWRLFLKWKLYFEKTLITITEANSQLLYKVEWLDGIPLPLPKHDWMQPVAMGSVFRS
ncbi:hypothetical protein ACA910_006487 [Epithemia clementina (nom. ined.)]